VLGEGFNHSLRAGGGRAPKDGRGPEEGRGDEPSP